METLGRGYCLMAGAAFAAILVGQAVAPSTTTGASATAAMIGAILGLVAIKLWARITARAAPSSENPPARRETPRD